ncbi:hypothetical protein [Shewanella sp. S1-58-MNA-CIBAN-0166]|uniref:hypothetical protein n=1 Tax=Shewanella sp. S1-58-MNA-CIBAN-0166 TaxID=3140467 RepID=UPI00332099D0
MNTTSEIRNKETSLAELMVKILKEPLNPLESSLHELKDGLSDTKDLIEEINDTLGASAIDTEKMGKTLRKIREEDFPALTSGIHKYIVNQFENESQKIANMLDANSNSHDEKLKSFSDALTEIIIKIVIQQSELKQFIEELTMGLDLKSESMMVAVQSTSNEIQLSRERSERSYSELIAKLDISHNEALIGLKKLSIELQDVIAHNLSIGKKAIDCNQMVLIDVLNQQHTALINEVTSSQTKFKSYIIISSIFFALMLSYVGYDIWSKLY